MELAFWVKCALLTAFLGFLFVIPGKSGRPPLGQLHWGFQAAIAAGVLFLAFMYPVGRAVAMVYPRWYWLAPVAIWVVLIAGLVRNHRRRAAESEDRFVSKS